ncbi:hypothetical protein CVT25_000559 [Psilocybe cyanescens]|uniref:Uncharacterized protein n=1 Tax=Psilocybe cyanescens TaxID=93625 RepID=A0A409WZQ7_PSICY|nr:hypothetical protein CVT25_000559 [Psilocybe cyanescens]
MSRGNARFVGARADIALKRKCSFSDFDAPPKYARSLQSPPDSSFDVEICHQSLRYDAKGSTPESKEISPVRDDDDIATSIGKFDAAFPSIRLRERLLNLDCATAQNIVDLLAENGYINEQALKILLCTAVKSIVFAPSMFDENGLNLVGDDTYSIFSYADSFRSLTELSFAGIRIQNEDLQHIHHLPSLSVLRLNETGIGNEGVFLLVSLKRTLTKLFLTANYDITNDAVPAILFLINLSFLSILDTGIDMIGLRRLAKHMDEEDHVMDIEIPFTCEAYVDNVTSHYLINPLPPLITNPHICGHLLSAALKRNLEAHAAYNPSIVTSGTRPEMLERLSKILEIRQLDLLVLGMLEGNC